MRCLVLFAAIFSFFLYPPSIYAHAVMAGTPEDVIEEDDLINDTDEENAIEDDDLSDQETVEDNIILQDQQDTDFFDELVNDYVTSLNQAIPPVYPPSIIDSGVYNTQVSINMDLVEEHSTDLVTIH